MKKVIKADIISNKKIAPDHFVMEIGAKWLAENALPGQFVLVKLRDKGTDPLLRIPIGVHDKTKNGIKMLYKTVGTGTEILSRKRKGEEIDILGPIGNSFDLEGVGKKTRVIIVAGGHGIAPLYGLAKTLAPKCRVDVFAGACSRKHVVYSKEIKKLGAGFHTSTEDGTCGLKGYITELVDSHLKLATSDKRQATRIFACGPRPMLAELARVLKKHGLPAQFSLDAYMACGIGACQGCAIRTKDGYKLVCKDGPVFGADEIDWEREKSGS